MRLKFDFYVQIFITLFLKLWYLEKIIFNSLDVKKYI